MTPIRAIIGQSFGRVGRLLFSPVSPSVWLRLIVISFLAGALGTGGCGLQSLTDSSAQPRAVRRAPVPAEKTADSVSAAEITPPEAEALARSRYSFVDGIFRPNASQLPAISPWWIAAVLIPLLILLLAAFLALWFFAILISVRFKFMWLRAVQEGQGGIRELYARCRSEAEDFFDFWLGLSALEALCYAASIGWLVSLVVAASGGWGRRIEWTPASALKVMAPAFTVLLVVWVFFSLIRIIADDFLVPLTARHPGRRRVWLSWVDLYRRHRVQVWSYLAIRLGLSVAWSLLQMAAAILFVLLWAFVSAILFGLFAWAWQTWTFLKPFFPFYAILIGGPLLAVLLTGIGATLLPGSVFFRDFSVRMLDRIEPLKGEIS